MVDGAGGGGGSGGGDGDGEFGMILIVVRQVVGVFIIIYTF